jgi:COP9 signalosome complex subunit 1
VIDIREIA